MNSVPYVFILQQIKASRHIFRRYSAIKLRSCLDIEFSTSGFKLWVSIKHPFYSQVRVFETPASTVYQVPLKIRYDVKLELEQISKITRFYNSASHTTVIMAFSFQLPQQL